MGHSEWLIFEKDRLETFKKNWKDLGFKLCTPENFAAAGFYNCNTDASSDTVKCFSCQKELGNWEEDDNPWEEHIKRGSKCPYVLFRSKKETTVQDFLDLQYETKKILLTDHFDQMAKSLHDKEKMILQKLNELQRTKK